MDAADGESEGAPLRLGELRQVREIGRGSFGVALLMEHERSRERCVVKRIDLSALSDK